MNDKQFSQVGRVIDDIGCIVLDIQDAARELLKSKVSADERKKRADFILQQTEFVSDATSAIYSECEESYAEGEEMVDTAVYASVLNRLPLASQVRTDQIIELCELLDKWRADNGFKIIL